MLKKFDIEISKIIFEHSKNKVICESNGFQDPDELLEEIFDIKGFSTLKELKSDIDLIDKIKMTDKQVLKDACEGLWTDSIEKLDPELEDEASSYEYCKQVYYFLNEMI